MDTPRLSRKQKRHLQQLRNDAAFVLAQPQALRFLCRILDDSGYFRDPFTGNSETFYRCGEQKTSRRIVAALEDADPDALMKLLQAAADERRKHAAEPEDERDDD